MKETTVKKTSLWDLFLSFLKIGALTFGGGYSMLPMLTRECVEKHEWVTEEQILDYFALSQCLPGLIAANTAAFIGSKERKALGAAVAMLGVITPSMIVILTIAALLKNFADIPMVQHAFGGIRVAVGALIVNTVIKLTKNDIKNILSIALCVIAFVLVAVFSLSPVYVVLGAALVGFGSGRLPKIRNEELGMRNERKKRK